MYRVSTHDSPPSKDRTLDHSLQLAVNYTHPNPTKKEETFYKMRLTPEVSLRGPLSKSCYGLVFDRTVSSTIILLDWVTVLVPIGDG
jgi:hypothetical protein